MLGVPDKANITDPVPVFTGPAVKVAVRPVTPVEAMACPVVTAPPLPPE